MKPVKVVWVDSREWASDWTQFDGPFVEMNFEELKITSVGFLAYEDENVIALIQNEGPDQLKGGMVIPRCSILALAELL